jgi:hypothetical protein
MTSKTVFRDTISINISRNSFREPQEAVKHCWECYGGCRETHVLLERRNTLKLMVCVLLGYEYPSNIQQYPGLSSNNVISRQ